MKAVDDGLKRAAPSSRGVDAEAIARFLDEAALLGVELNSLMVWRDGAVVAEGWWWPYGPARRHMLHSATKSFLSAGVGIAIAERRFALTDRVLSFFPQHAPAQVDAHLAAMAVEDLLTQTSGHAHGTSGSLWRRIPTSWIAEFLKIAVPYAPGSTFRYSSATSFMLSAILTATTGDSAHAYLRPRLLEPLGIDDLGWDMGPENINPGGNGISAPTAALLKLALLHHRGGVWAGRRLLPADWVAAATTPRRGNPYGYHWWVGPGGSFYAYGVFGQFAVVFPDHDAIVVTTAATPNGEETLRSLIWHHFPDAFARAATTDDADDRLAARLAALRLLPPLAPARSPREAAVSGVRLAADPNDDGIIAFTLIFDGVRCRFVLEDGRGRHEVLVGLDDWIESDTTMSGAALHHGYEPGAMRVVAGGRWTRPDRFEMTWQFVETAFRDRVVLDIDAAGAVRMRRSVNTNTLPTIRPVVVARATAGDQGSGVGKMPA